MKLTSHTDYGLRVLVTLALLRNRLVTIEELANRHRVSKNHLMKVVQTLVSHELVKSVRGRGGGLTLAREPALIRMGAVVRQLEDDMVMVACLGDGHATCALTGACRLTLALNSAIEAFFRELDRLSLADLVVNQSDLQKKLGLETRIAG
jgi:Rrf2 family transcriptional regulator, nitric oxide-sensitive transcriptional repressor